MNKKKLKKMVMLSLFSGIGGIDIAAERAGIKTIAFCEKDTFSINPRTWNGRLLDQPPIRRVVDGVPRKLDKLTKSRLKALGNAVVPAQIYPIFKYIKEIENLIESEKGWDE